MEQKAKSLNDREVSEMLSVKRQTLANWRFQGKNLPFVKFGRSVRYLLEDVDKFLQANKVKVRD